VLRAYELMIIIDSDVGTADVDSVIAQVADLVAEEGGACEQHQANDDESHGLSSAGAGSLAHYPVAGPVVHERVGGVAAADGSNPMGAGLRAGDPPVEVVVPESQRVDAGAG